MAEHSQHAYNTGRTAFELFRSGHHFESSWPPLVDHIVSFVAFLSIIGLADTTARLYFSSIGYKCKLTSL